MNHHSVNKPILLLLGLALLAACVWLLVRGSGDPPEPLRAAAGESSPAPSEVVRPVQNQEASRSDNLREEVAPAPDTEPARVSPATGESLAGLTGRFLLPGGAPAQGVTVTVQGWGANQERVLKHGEPKDWEDPAGTTGPDGRFLLEFEPPRAYQFLLRANHPGYSEVRWRWSSLPAGELKDVGTIELQRGAIVEGRILDAEGRPIPANWSVSLESSYRPPGDGGDKTRVTARADPATTEFRLEGVPPGGARLRAQSRITNNISGPEIQVVAGEVLKADIIYEDAADLARRITVTTFNRQFYTYNNPQPGSLKLRAADGTVRTFQHLQGSSQTEVVDGLVSGSYIIELDDRRFNPWQRSNVSPGTAVDLVLEGSAGIRLSVVWAETLEPIHDYRLRLRMEEGNTWPKDFELRSVGSAAPAGGFYDHLIPEDQTLIVDVEGCATTEVSVKALAPHEIRDVTASMSRGALLRGRVTQAQQGVPGLNVWLDRIPESPERPWRDATSAADGSFVFEYVPFGEYELAVAKSWTVSCRVSDVLVNQARPPEVLLVLPAEGSVSGRVVGPQGATFGGLAIWMAPVPDGRKAAELDPYERELPSQEAPLDPQGHFLVDGMRAGSARAWLKLPDTSAPRPSGGRLGFRGGVVGLGDVIVPAGGVSEVVFDASDRFPGKLRVTLLLDGADHADLVLEGRLQGNERFTGVGGTLDPDRPTEFAYLSAGLWSLSIRPVATNWRYVHPTPVAVPAGGVVSVAISFRLRSGELKVLNAATGEALPLRKISLEAPDRAGPIILRTDSRGVLSLTLPEGSDSLGNAPLLWQGPELPSMIELVVEEDR